MKIEFENAPSARASDSFWSKYLLHKKIKLLILPEKCWESLYAVRAVIVLLIKKRSLLKKMHTAPLHTYNLKRYMYQ